MVDIPAPQAAQVIRYAYLWADEHAAGREEGAKDRPAAIVVTTVSGDAHNKVVVVPITHVPPSPGTDAVEMPAAIKRHLGLDNDRSWVVVDEINVFQWPGPDLRATGIPGTESVLYGFLPSGFFRAIRDRLTANIRAGRLRQVPRIE